MTDTHAADAVFASLLDTIPASASRRHARELLRAAVDLVTNQPNTLDMKIASAALREMTDAFAMFGGVPDDPKVSIFGSARTQKEDPLYEAARQVAARLATKGWMVITGAGPGIMEAGMEGAGRERSIGVSIRLPFEQSANPIIAGDQKYVSMKYFFTRKLMLIKESKGFVCLPGGFGTLDEMFELLTWNQLNLHDKKVYVLNTAGFYGHLHDHMQHLYEHGFLYGPVSERVRLFDDPVTLVEALLKN